MVEASRIYASKDEAKREKSVPNVRKRRYTIAVEYPLDHILSLQRTIGNQAVQRLMKYRTLQTKLRFKQAGDVHEQEVVRMGDAMMKMQKSAELQQNCYQANFEDRVPRDIIGSLVWQSEHSSKGLNMALEEQLDNLNDGTIPSPPWECSCKKRKEEEGKQAYEAAPKALTEDAIPEHPREEGWWTGNWYTGSNTIICDGANGITIHEATNYDHGVQECTRKHENEHKDDWIARYGAGICTGRKKGDLPYYDPPGKEAYADFLNKSECKAWRTGEACRKEKLKACGTDDTCKNYVQMFVTQAEQMVKKYC